MAGLGSGTNYIPSNVSFESSLNTTLGNLAALATYTGTGEQNQQPYVIVDCTVDVAGTLFFDFSVDGTNWSTYPVDGYSVGEGGGRLFRSAYKGPRYFRVRYVNGDTLQNTFRLYTYYDGIGLLDNALNQPLSLNSGAISTRPTNFEDEKILGLRSGLDVVYKFAERTDLDTADNDALVFPDNTTNALVVMSSADTFDITYNSGTDGDGTTGALSLAIQYLDSDNKIQTAVHVLGSTGSDTTSFSGLGINRVVVLSAGTAKTNTNNISISDTTNADRQSFVSAGIGFAQDCDYHMPDNADGILKSMTFGAVRVGGGSSPKVKFSLKLFNRDRNTEYVVFRETIDTDIQTHRELFGDTGYRIRSNDVIFVTAETDTNNTELFVRYQIDVHTQS